MSYNTSANQPPSAVVRAFRFDVPNGKRVGSYISTSSGDSALGHKDRRTISSSALHLGSKCFTGAAADKVVRVAAVLSEN